MSSTSLQGSDIMSSISNMEAFNSPLNETMSLSDEFEDTFSCSSPYCKENVQVILIPIGLSVNFMGFLVFYSHPQLRRDINVFLPCLLVVDLINMGIQLLDTMHKQGTITLDLRFWCPIYSHLIHSTPFLCNWIIVLYGFSHLRQMLAVHRRRPRSQAVYHCRYGFMIGMLVLLAITMFFHYIWMMGVVDGSCRHMFEWNYFTIIFSGVDFYSSRLTAQVALIIFGIWLCVRYCRQRSTHLSCSCPPVGNDSFHLGGVRSHQWRPAVETSSIFIRHASSETQSLQTISSFSHISSSLSEEPLTFLLPLVQATCNLPMNCAVLAHEFRIDTSNIMSICSMLLFLTHMLRVPTMYVGSSMYRAAWFHSVKRLYLKIIFCKKSGSCRLPTFCDKGGHTSSSSRYFRREGGGSFGNVDSSTALTAELSRFQSRKETAAPSIDNSSGVDSQRIRTEESIV